jgi:hypothetical protein
LRPPALLLLAALLLSPPPLLLLASLAPRSTADATAAAPLASNECVSADSGGREPRGGAFSESGGPDSVRLGTVPTGGVAALSPPSSLS